MHLEPIKLSLDADTRGAVSKVCRGSAVCKSVTTVFDQVLSMHKLAAFELRCGFGPPHDISRG